MQKQKPHWRKDELEQAGCPLCGSDLPGSWLPRGDGLEVALCGCGLGYLSPRPRRELIDRLYQEAYFEGGDQGIGYSDYLSSVRRRAEPGGVQGRLAALVDRQCGGLTGKRLLDVGCGPGAFMLAAARLGAEVRGVEPAEDAAAAGREQLGLTIETGYLDGVEARHDVFDVVTLFEVIEHPYDPRVLAAQLAEVTRPGGTLVLSTPNFGLTRVYGQRYHGLRSSYEHLTYWSVAPLRRLLSEAGYEPRAFVGLNHRFVQPNPGDAPLRGAVRRLLRPLVTRLPLDLAATTLVAVARRA